ncbi:hypothetical protein FRB94_000023 [Tulasnella sp. JGI-2019a]|nr:hypothetical protein FRB93_004497 [Tulasnella sp. JGI-2019a]KAG9015419.1 hypothetical protein FRB94_000023 [Tulasnella sp. JGI-2019a]KAG9037673.1 hypothetical protein FRB95_004519 [Tulasnella sp. JGI-2019a]
MESSTSSSNAALPGKLSSAIVNGHQRHNSAASFLLSVPSAPLPATETLKSHLYPAHSGGPDTWEQEDGRLLLEQRLKAIEASRAFSPRTTKPSHRRNNNTISISLSSQPMSISLPASPRTINIPEPPRTPRTLGCRRASTLPPTQDMTGLEIRVVDWDEASSREC